MWIIRSSLVSMALTLLASGALPRPLAASETPLAFLPLADVRPGMTGIGRTVFEGTQIEDFKVQIIGVIENVAPKHSMILARLEGGPLEKTGVIAGMSGSPVFVDGRLVGAIAYGFPFSKETIAGITPFEEMAEVTRSTAPRAASARFPLSALSAAKAPLDRDTLVAALRRPFQPVSPNAVLRGSLPDHLAPAALQPLALPMVFSGFEPGIFEWAKGIFSPLGFAPLVGGAGKGRLPDPLPDLQPGGPLGVSLVEGDLDLSVTGTITAIDRDRVYAFGHPFFNLGPTQFPMKKAYVYSVFPSLYQSWKISVPGEGVGTIEQDRSTAIAGRLGPPPRMIPVDVKLGTSRGQEHAYSLRIVEDELFSPLLAYISLASVLQSNERAFGTSTIRLRARLVLTGQREIRLDDLFTEDQPVQQAAALVAAPLAYVMNNDFQRVEVERLEVDVSSLETIQTATLARAWIERSGPVRPGSELRLKIWLRTHRGETRTETIPLTIPASAAPGNYSVLIADGSALTAVEQREMRQTFVPRDLDQLLRAINSLRRNNHLYVRLLRAEDGAIVSGEYLQALPPSVLAVLGGGSAEDTVIPIRTAAIWDYDLATDYALTGSRLLSLTVER
jgi:hypothetical protein